MSIPIQSRKLSELREEYTRLFDTAVIRPSKQAAVSAIIDRIVAARGRYEAVSRATGVPWGVIAAIHNMEASLSFTRHLHNGDPLSARTVQVPVGRPRTGNPPFKWEASAEDALAYDGLTTWKDWSVPGTLFKLEGFNGWGTRRKGVFTPYLWSFTNHYEKGKYVADGVWDSEAVSKQCGAAAILRRLGELRLIDFADQPAPAPRGNPLVARYRTSKSKDQAETARAIELQQWLNTFPGVWVKVDGVPGKLTSDAYRLVTGRYLPGDSRA